jgi:hypothetical protein
MLQPKELRPGNFYRFTAGDYVVMLYGYDALLDEVQLARYVFRQRGTAAAEGSVQQGEHPRNMLGDIPITEEVLQRCGFTARGTRTEDRHIWILEGLAFRHYPETGVVTFSFENNLVEGKVEMNYLHELQHLFFSITGQELDFGL